MPVVVNFRGCGKIRVRGPTLPRSTCKVDDVWSVLIAIIVHCCVYPGPPAKWTVLVLNVTFDAIGDHGCKRSATHPPHAVMAFPWES